MIKKLQKMKLFRLASGKWVAKPIDAAITLGLPHLIGPEQTGLSQLAEQTSSHPDYLRRLLLGLSALGIFKALAGDYFKENAMSRLLREDDVSSLFGMFQSDWHDAAWNRLADSVRAGVPAFELAMNEPAFSWFKKHPEAANQFNQAGNHKSRQLGSWGGQFSLSRFNRVCDIGGGLGGLLIELLKNHPHLSGIVYDLAYLEKAATVKLIEAGLMDRSRFVAGDMFQDDLPESDLYLLSNILHDWDDKRCRQILSKLRTAMDRDKRLLIIEMILPKKRNRFSIASLMDLEVMVMGGGMERNLDQYRELLNQAGLKIARRIRNKGGFSMLECRVV